MPAITDELAANQRTLHLLREAVKAKLAYWDANGALESHLGLPGGSSETHPDPDAACEAIEQEISTLASSYPEGVPGMEAVTAEHVTQLLTAIEEAS